MAIENQLHEQLQQNDELKENYEQEIKRLNKAVKKTECKVIMQQEYEKIIKELRE